MPIPLLSRSTETTIRSALAKDLQILNDENHYAIFGKVSWLLQRVTANEVQALRYFLNGTSISEIDQKHGISTETVLNLINRIITDLSQRIVVHEKLPPVKSLLMIVTEECNLACRYCYCRYHKKNQHYEKMNEATARRVIEFASKMGVKAIAFFGGEPLLNLPVIRSAVSYAKELGFNCQFSMSTNATLVTEDGARFLSENNIKASVSFDGPKDVHNTTRVFIDGSGTFDQVRAGIEILKKWSLLEVIEATYSMKHPSKLDAILSELAKDSRYISCTCVDGDSDCDYKDHVVTGERLSNYYQGMLDFTLKSTTKGDKIHVGGMHELLGSLRSNSATIRPYICAGVMQRLTVGVKGELYPCPETMKNRFIIGNVWEDNIESALLDRKRAQVLQRLLKDRIEDDYWFSNLLDICVVRLSENSSGNMVLRDADAVATSLEKFLVRVAHSDLP